MRLFSFKEETALIEECSLSLDAVSTSTEFEVLMLLLLPVVDKGDNLVGNSIFLVTASYFENVVSELSLTNELFGKRGGYLLAFVGHPLSCTGERQSKGKKTCEKNLHCLVSLFEDVYSIS